ncbi:MAG: hypothetical protein RJB39_154 [Candidatus Parcubacteria bacterium]|jgi:hypothetical protein
MKKIFTILVLSAVIVIIIVWNVRASIENKDNAAQTLRVVGDKTLTGKGTAISGFPDDKPILDAMDTANNSVPEKPYSQKICGDSRACNYNPAGPSIGQYSCMYAVYDMAFGSRNARTCQPSKTNAELEVIPDFAPNSNYGYPANGRTCSLSPDSLNIHVHKWSYDSEGNLASNTNYFLGSYSGHWSHTPAENKKILTQDAKDWQGKSACKQMAEFEKAQNTTQQTKPATQAPKYLIKNPLNGMGK